MRIWLVTLSDPIPTDNIRPMRFMGLADQLLERGHEVTVWTTTFFHHTKSHRFPCDTVIEVGRGYRVNVLRTWSYRSNISLRRALAHWQFGSRLRQAMSREAPPSLIVVSLPAPALVSASLDFANPRGIPVVMDVIDPWPEVFMCLPPPAMQGVARALLAPLFWQARLLFRRLDGITGISNTYVSWALHVRGDDRVRAAAFYPAVDLSKYRRRTGQPAGGPVRFLYAGSLGRMYDLETVIECASRLWAKGAANVEFLIAGDGPMRSELQRKAQGLPNVTFTGWLRADALVELMAGSDVGIASYAHKASQSITYKLFDYLAAGLPVLCSLRGEMAELLARERVGLCYEPGDSAGLAELVELLSADKGLVRAMQARAREFAERAGDARVVYKEMAAFLEQVAREKASSIDHLVQQSAEATSGPGCSV